MLVVGLVQAAVLYATATNTEPVIAAAVGGVFLVVNSILTIVLTRIIDRDKRSQYGKPARTKTKDRSAATGNGVRRHRGNGG